MKMDTNCGYWPINEAGKSSFPSVFSGLQMENIHFVLKANSITSGVEEDIRDYLTLHPNIKLVIYEVNRIGNNVNQIAYNTNAVRFSSNKYWGELQTKYFELMTLFCQFALRENGEEKLWYKKILELMPKDDSSTERNLWFENVSYNLTYKLKFHSPLMLYD